MKYQEHTVITPAPSKEEGLIEGDGCRCGPAMRAAIIELAKELGILEGYGGSDDKSVEGVWNIHGRGLVYRVCNFEGLTELTPEEFMAKMRITAALPKPEPPINIESYGKNYQVQFRAGDVKIGCTTIDNATVRLIASKLID